MITATHIDIKATLPPGTEQDIELAKHAFQCFAYLIPKRPHTITWLQFAEMVEKHCVAIQAVAVVRAIRRLDHSQEIAPNEQEITIERNIKARRRRFRK